MRRAVPLLLFLAGCPASTSSVDPCAGVSCAAGRTCVSGACVPVENRDSSLWFLDSRLDLVAGERLDRGGDAASAIDGPRSDGKKSSDAKKPDLPTKKPDLVKADTRNPDTRPPDTRTPDLVPPGKWYQASSQVCPTFCAGLGRANVGSPEGARCMSGEARPQSGVAAGIAFSYGCWSSCAAMAGAIASVSVGSYCYFPGQKQDGDDSDRTVGCFCR